MKVSVIIPIYKVEPYIERCIQSVLRQTYRNLEVILVDDCTPDRSMEIARACIEQSPLSKDLQIVCLRHEQNRGVSAARNTGVEAASGEYVFFIDSDDELTNDCIALLSQQAKDNPEVEMVQGLTKSVPYRDYYDIPHSDTSLYVDDNAWVRFHYYYIPQRIIPVNVWNKLILKSFITKCGLYFMEGIIHEDELWMYEAVKRLSKYATVPKITYIHYSTEGSIMNSEKSTQISSNWSVILETVLKELDHPLKEIQLLTYSLIAKNKLSTKEAKIKWLLFRYALCHFRNHSYKIAFYFMVYTLLYPHGGRQLNNAISSKYSKYSTLYT